MLSFVFLRVAALTSLEVHPPVRGQTTWVSCGYFLGVYKTEVALAFCGIKSLAFCGITSLGNSVGVGHFFPVVKGLRILVKSALSSSATGRPGGVFFRRGVFVAFAFPALPCAVEHRFGE